MAFMACEAIINRGIGKPKAERYARRRFLSPLPRLPPRERRRGDCINLVMNPTALHALFSDRRRPTFNAPHPKPLRCEGWLLYLRPSSAILCGATADRTLGTVPGLSPTDTRGADSVGWCRGSARFDVMGGRSLPYGYRGNRHGIASRAENQHEMTVVYHAERAAACNRRRP